MTLSSTTVLAQYSGDGSTSSFGVTFVFWDDSDVTVVLTDANGTETTWTKGTQYNLTGGSGATGTVTVVTSPTDYTPASGETLTIYSNRTDTQTLSLPQGGEFPSASVEQALDQIVRLIQQLRDELGRNLSYPVTEPTGTSAALPIKGTRASNILGFDANGEPEAVDPASLAELGSVVSSYIATLLDDTSAQNARTTLNQNTSSITELTIAAGSVTLTGPIHKIDTEGDAASDTLSTTVIAGQRLSGDFLILLAASAARTVNIDTSGSFGASVTLSATIPTVFMLSGSTWYPVGSQLPRDFISGLVTSNGTDADHDIDIAVGECRGLGNVGDLRLGSALTKQIDAAWAVGSAAGGLFTGSSPSNNTMYGVWLIRRDDTGVVDAGFSTEMDAASLPSDIPANYTQARLIGAVLTDGSGNIIAFTHIGNELWFTGDVIGDISDNSITDQTYETGTLSVPPKSIAFVYVAVDCANTIDTVAAVWLRTKNAADDVSSTVEAVALVQADTGDTIRSVTVSAEVRVDSNSQVEYAADRGGSETATVSIRTRGFRMLTRSDPQ